MPKITKAILTGGGRATRLRPITNTINKHLIPLANQPMIFHAIEKAAAAGIKEIFINTNPGETQIQTVVGDGGRWGIKIKYFEQTGGPRGVAHVVKCAEKFIKQDPFLFYFSDNIILGSIKTLFERFESEQLDCLLSFAEVPDPERFGVPRFDAAGNLLEVIEKPVSPPSNLAQTGIYLYGPKVYFKAFKNIKPSARGEYEISDVNTYLIKKGLAVGWQKISGWWKDTGLPEDLIAANKLLLDQMPAEEFKAHADKNGARLAGNVHLGRGTRVGKKVKIIGPALIGENCALENCAVGPYVTLGAGTAVKNAAVAESIIFGNCRLEASIKIKNSIIGEQAQVLKGTGDNYHRLIVGDHTVIEV